MLKTPPQFTPHITSIEHAAPSTLIFRGDELLLRQSDLAVADNALCQILEILPEQCYPVGSLGEQHFRTTWVKRDASAPQGYEFRKLRSLLGVVDDTLAAIAGRGYQIAEWARTHQYCGVCACKTIQLPGERCMKCPECGMAAYPRISPAMMVLIRKGDALLLARNATSPTGRFSALAGFLEAGESVEDAVHREVLEEVRLKVHNLRYFGSQAWAFPHSLMIAYTAEYLSGEIQIDQNEIAEARWYEPGDELPPYASDISIAGDLINNHLTTFWRR